MIGDRWCCWKIVRSTEMTSGIKYRRPGLCNSHLSGIWNKMSLPCRVVYMLGTPCPAWTCSEGVQEVGDPGRGDEAGHLDPRCINKWFYLLLVCLLRVGFGGLSARRPRWFRHGSCRQQATLLASVCSQAEKAWLMRFREQCLRCTLMSVVSAIGGVDTITLTESDRSVESTSIWDPMR